LRAIETTSLSKQFGSTQALNNISIHVNQGEIYGFLGLNGAGKTTLIQILLGMIKPNTGSVKLFEHKLDTNFHFWNKVGYLVETPYSYPNLSVIENLIVYYQLRKLKDKSLIDTVVDRLKLNAYAHIKANHLSLGNQQRLGLAKALFHKPELLILDEPINGLDPEGIVEVRELLLDFARNGSTVFLSSHILGEISKVANRIAIIHQGRLVNELTTSQLINQQQRKLIVKTTSNADALMSLGKAGIGATINNANEIEIIEPSILDSPEQICTLLVSNGTPPTEIYLWKEDLEHYFLRTIKQSQE
jgi:ABC-2 type transport system ATP-binding protein